MLMTKEEEIFENKENQELNEDEEIDIIDEDGDLLEDDLEYSEEEILKNISSKNEVSRDLVKQYLQEIGRYPLLSLEEEADIGARIKRGDKEAEQILIQSNLRLVVSIAKRFLSSGVPFLDLIQDGNLGLMKAVERFDIDKGYKFSTYATWWIRQSIQRSIYDHAKTIRRPVHLEETLRRINSFKAKYEQDTGFLPTPEVIAENMNLSIDKVKDALSYNSNVLSMETPIGEEEENSIGDFIPDESMNVEKTIIEGQLQSDIFSAMDAVLTDKEANIIKMRYGLDGTGRFKTLEECGAYFGVTRERIRQIESKALRKLKRSRKSRELLYSYKEEV